MGRDKGRVGRTASWEQHWVRGRPWGGGGGDPCIVPVLPLPEGAILSKSLPPFTFLTLNGKWKKNCIKKQIQKTNYWLKKQIKTKQTISSIYGKELISLTKNSNKLVKIKTQIIRKNSHRPWLVSWNTKSKRPLMTTCSQTVRKIKNQSNIGKSCFYASD